jgi:hypothetical protein
MGNPTRTRTRFSSDTRQKCPQLQAAGQGSRRTSLDKKRCVLRVFLEIFRDFWTSSDVYGVGTDGHRTLSLSACFQDHFIWQFASMPPAKPLPKSDCYRTSQEKCSAALYVSAPRIVSCALVLRLLPTVPRAGVGGRSPARDGLHTPRLNPEYYGTQVINRRPNSWHTSSTYPVELRVNAKIPMQRLERNWTLVHPHSAPAISDPAPTAPKRQAPRYRPPRPRRPSWRP